MGVHENIAHDRFPKQGRNHFLRAKVVFHHDTAHQFNGVILRDDIEAPHVLVIALLDGRVVLGTECQWSPIPDDVVLVDHGPVKPPYGTPERAAYDREHGGAS